MSDTAEKFLALLRYAIGTQDKPPTVADDEWPTLIDIAAQQALPAVIYPAIARLSRQVALTEEVKLTWFFMHEQTVEASRRADKAAARVYRTFRKSGYDCCLLKGQGNALMYPDPAARSSGDVDLWVCSRPGTSFRELTDDLVSTAKAADPAAHAVYHHIDFPPVGDVPVEVHYRPTFMNNLIHNRRLQQWCRGQAAAQCAHTVELPGGGTVSVPTDAFNRVYQLSHIAHHLFHEGVGLRHVLDYYYLLRRGCSESERRHEEQLLRRLGLYPVAAGLMYVLTTALGMDASLTTVPPDERRGRFMLSEMLLAGNFGHADSRQAANPSRIGRNWQRLRRDARFMSYFPSECLWEPVFRLYNFQWRLRHNSIMHTRKQNTTKATPHSNASPA